MVLANDRPKEAGSYDPNLNSTTSSRYAESPTRKFRAIVLQASSQGVTVRILLFVTLFDVADMLTVVVVVK